MNVTASLLSTILAAILKSGFRTQTTVWQQRNSDSPGSNYRESTCCMCFFFSIFLPAYKPILICFGRHFEKIRHLESQNGYRIRVLQAKILRNDTKHASVSINRHILLFSSAILKKAAILDPKGNFTCLLFPNHYFGSNEHVCKAASRNSEMQYLALICRVPHPLLISVRQYEITMVEVG